MRRLNIAPLRAALALGVALAVWQAVVWLTGVPRFILPGPGRVGMTLWDNAALLAERARFTALNLLTGLAAGVALGVATAS